MTKPQVGIIMGSKSDWETMRHAAETLEQLASSMRPRSSPRTGPPSAFTNMRIQPRSAGSGW